MSCRVLGRKVEEATLTVLAAAARRLGVTSLQGEYLPTAKNAMVKDHYSKLGFTVDEASADATRYRLDLAAYVAPELPMLIETMHPEMA
jgi:predicted enzyme involved in methoxymalonyl-ACP biosynthesis